MRLPTTSESRKLDCTSWDGVKLLREIIWTPRRCRTVSPEIGGTGWASATSNLISRGNWHTIPPSGDTASGKGARHMVGISVTEDLIRSAAADLEAAADAIDAMLAATSVPRNSVPSGIDEASMT